MNQKRDHQTEQEGARSVWVSPTSEYTGVADVDEMIDAAPDVGSAYSNFDHEFDEEVCDLLVEGCRFAVQHAAWDYCGWVWRDGRVFREQVRRYGVPVAEYTSNDLRALIHHVVEEHGSD